MLHCFIVAMISQHSWLCSCSPSIARSWIRSQSTRSWKLLGKITRPIGMNVTALNCLEIMISKKIPTLTVLMRMRMSQLREKEKILPKKKIYQPWICCVSIVRKCVIDYVDWLNMKLTAKFLINRTIEVEYCFYFIVDES